MQATEAEAPKAADKPVESRHDEVDAERFNTEGTITAYAPNTEDPDTEETPAPEESAPPPRTGSADEIQAAAAAVPDVMVLPEPESNRPTVVLDRGAVPGQGTASRPRLAPSRADHARVDRAIQDRVRAERTSALLETSPFWLDDDQRPAAEEVPDRPQRTVRPPRHRGREPRRPVSGLLALLVLALVATFFSWVSAEPFWLAVGHGRPGTATVAGCTGSGVAQRCTGEFTTADGAYTVRPIALLGVEPSQRAAGSTIPARMVSTDSRQAYVGATGVLVHLRWSLGFVLVLLCGLGIAGLTGVRRLETARARRAALLISLAAPLTLLAGFLVTAY
ncbi:hypothetical protein [Actinoplanes sp. NPDC049681]|uniref:hypothetical protein n=1 Tax=Actinoplanes sp. NPDC049681 TaxID=3363905 RepID=UPI003799B1E1